MYESVDEALASLDLQPGETYRTTVKGYELEVRALEETKPEEEESQFADQVMLEPWFTTPKPPPLRTFTLKPGKLRLPDPPIIPPEYEGFE
jgi:hypothetical protein